jgi:hypothetical protein
MSKNKAPKRPKYNPPAGVEPTDPRHRGIRLINKMLCDVNVGMEGFMKDLIRFDYERRQWLEIKPDIDLSQCQSPHSTQRKLQAIIETENSARHDMNYSIYHGCAPQISAHEYPALVKAFVNVLLRMNSERECTKYLSVIRNHALLRDVLDAALSHPKGMAEVVGERLREIQSNNGLVSTLPYGIERTEQLVFVDELPWYDNNKRKSEAEIPKRGHRNAMAAALAISALGRVATHR